MAQPEPVMFTHVQQPNDYTCGPSVVAIVTGRPLDEVIKRMRPIPGRGVPNAQITRMLRHYDVNVGPRFMSVRGRALPDVAIVRVCRRNTKMGHVIVKRGRTWFDPMLDKPLEMDAPPTHASGRRVWFLYDAHEVITYASIPYITSALAIL